MPPGSRHHCPPREIFCFMKRNTFSSFDVQTPLLISTTHHVSSASWWMCSHSGKAHDARAAGSVLKQQRAKCSPTQQNLLAFASTAPPDQEGTPPVLHSNTMTTTCTVVDRQYQSRIPIRGPSFFKWLISCKNGDSLSTVDHTGG